MTAKSPKKPDDSRVGDYVARGELPPAPVADLIGFTIEIVERGKALATLQTDERHTNPMGTVHGGILCDIADAAMGVAMASALEAGETFTTLELKINFLRPVWQSELKAIATIVKRGKTVSMLECDVLDSEDKLVARASSTVMTLRGDMAAGR